MRGLLISCATAVLAAGWSAAAQGAARGADPQPPARAAPTNLTQGEIVRALGFPQKDGYRIALQFSKPPEYKITQSDGRARIDVTSRDVVDLVDARADRPDYIKTMEGVRNGAKTIITLTLAPGAKVTDILDDAALMLDVSAPPAAAPAPENGDGKAASDAGKSSADTSADASFDGAPIEVTNAYRNDALTFSLSMGGSAPVTVFQIKNDVWAVFPGKHEVTWPDYFEDEGRVLESVDTVPFKGAAVLHFAVAGGALASLAPSADGWTLRIGWDRTVSAPIKMEASYNDALGRERRFFAFKNPGVPLDLPAEIAGRKLVVTPAGAPARGLGGGLALGGYDTLASLNGLVIAPSASDVFIDATEGGVSVVAQAAPSAHPFSAKGPAFIDVAAWDESARKTEFLSTEHALADAVSTAEARYRAAEAALSGTSGASSQEQSAIANAFSSARGGLNSARATLAEFYLANRLGAEALAALDAGEDAEWADPARRDALAGIAQYFMGHDADAEKLLSADALRNDAHANAWRGLVAVDAGRWSDARRYFDDGETAFEEYPDGWKNEFLLAQARAAIESGDGATAKRAMDKLAPKALSPEQAARGDLLIGDMNRLGGANDKARRRYEVVKRDGIDPYAAWAELHLMQMDSRAGRIAPEKYKDALERLRYRWPGGAFERRIAYEIGAAAVANGHYKEGLDAWRRAVQSAPDAPETADIIDQMGATFRDIFIDGAKDMAPMDALSLFYDNVDLAPRGDEGDRMIRLLADRLIELDLLKPAAELLQHQIKQRLRSGQKRAEVGLDLARVELMNHDADAALRAIRSTRLARLPSVLVDERRLTEATALSQLDRLQPALELLYGMSTAEARALRAEIYWRMERWSDAAGLYVGLVDGHGAALSDADADYLLRAAIAYALDNDELALVGLSAQWSDEMAKTPDGAQFAAIVERRTLDRTDLDKAAAQLDTSSALESFMQGYRARFRPAGTASGETPAP